MARHKRPTGKFIIIGVNRRLWSSNCAATMIDMISVRSCAAMKKKHRDLWVQLVSIAPNWMLAWGTYLLESGVLFAAIEYMIDERIGDPPPIILNSGASTALHMGKNCQQ